MEAISLVHRGEVRPVNINVFRRRDRKLEPISELMRAIVLTAVWDLRSSSAKREEALQFLFAGEDESEYVFSFVSICQHFGLDPIKARAAILKGNGIKTRRRNH